VKPPPPAATFFTSPDYSPAFPVWRGMAVTVAAGKPAPLLGAPNLVNNPG
jgi:hypothetical protein